MFVSRKCAGVRMGGVSMPPFFVMVGEWFFFPQTFFIYFQVWNSRKKNFKLYFYHKYFPYSELEKMFDFLKIQPYHIK